MNICTRLIRHTRLFDSGFLFKKAKLAQLQQVTGVVCEIALVSSLNLGLATLPCSQYPCVQPRLRGDFFTKDSTPFQFLYL